MTQGLCNLHKLVEGALAWLRGRFFGPAGFGFIGVDLPSGPLKKRVVIGWTLLKHGFTGIFCVVNIKHLAGTWLPQIVTRTLG